MALSKDQLIELARANARASLNPSTTFSVGGEKLSADALNKTFIAELNELGKTPQDFRENKNLIYTLMEVSLTEVLPPKILQAYGQFADVRTFAQGTKPVYKIKISEASKKRAKQFVTRVGLAGRYEVFKLDGYSLEVPTAAYGGASRIEWEELLDNRMTMNDYYSLVLEGMDEAIYREIAKALEATVADIKATNKTVQTSFNEAAMDQLLMTADVYGKSTIYCTFEFAATMIPVASNTTNWNAFSDGMKEQLWNNGAFATYKGHQVVILPQSFTDETNTTKVIDPSYAWIIPTGAEKPVKVAFEGGAQVKSFDNRDWSTEIQTYQKLGVATYLVNPGICVYKNTSLSKTMASLNQTGW
jgi:hypothetical protein